MVDVDASNKSLKSSSANLNFINLTSTQNQNQNQSLANSGNSNLQFNPNITVTPNIVLNTNSKDIGGFGTGGTTSSARFDPSNIFDQNFSPSNNTGYGGGSGRPEGRSMLTSFAGPIASAVGGYAAGYMLGVNPTVSAGLSAASFYAGEFVSPGQDIYSTGIRLGVGAAATVGGLYVTSAPIDLSLAVGGISSAAGEAAIRIFNPAGQT